MDITEVKSILDNMYDTATKVNQINDPIIWALHQTLIIVKNEQNPKMREGKMCNYEAVQKWRSNNPQGKKIDCSKETGLSRPTVDRYWNQ